MRASLTTGRPAYVVEVGCCMGVGAWLYLCALVSFRDECDTWLGTQLQLLLRTVGERRCVLVPRGVSPMEHRMVTTGVALVVEDKKAQVNASGTMRTLTRELNSVLSALIPNKRPDHGTLATGLSLVHYGYSTQESLDRNGTMYSQKREVHRQSVRGSALPRPYPAKQQAKHQTNFRSSSPYLRLQATPFQLEPPVQPGF